MKQRIENLTINITNVPYLEEGRVTTRTSPELELPIAEAFDQVTNLRKKAAQFSKMADTISDLIATEILNNTD